MFSFFLTCYRKGLLTFCGVHVGVEFDLDGNEGKLVFRQYDNGQYQQGKTIISRHPNIVKGVITGKKSWGLFVRQWSQGIGDCDFTIEEIINEFEIKGITIPQSLLRDFQNQIKKYKINKYSIDLLKVRHIY